jgi:hypothetical protein
MLGYLKFVPFIIVGEEKILSLYDLGFRAKKKYTDLLSLSFMCHKSLPKETKTPKWANLNSFIIGLMKNVVEKCDREKSIIL